MFAELYLPSKVFDNATKVKEDELANRAKNVDETDTRVQDRRVHKGDVRDNSNVDKSTEDKTEAPNYFN